MCLALAAPLAATTRETCQSRSATCTLEYERGVRAGHVNERGAMAREDREIRLRGDITPDPATTEPSLGELFKRLTTDTTELIRAEAALAKVEMREVGAQLGQDVSKIGIATGLALIGAFALAACAIIGLGDLFDNYAAAALLVGVILLAVGGFMARKAMDDIKRRGLKPQKTVQTLRDDASWAKEEARELKSELTR
jgi:uncharacterized membrane protein YqjE